MPTRRAAPTASESKNLEADGVYEPTQGPTNRVAPPAPAANPSHASDGKWIDHWELPVQDDLSTWTVAAVLIIVYALVIAVAYITHSPACA